MSETLLEIKNLKKYFPIKKGFLGKPRGFVRAVDDVSLTLVKEQHLGIVGESGSGKSTLARLVLRLIPCDSGSVIFSGQDISQLKAKQFRPFRKQMQMVFQDPYSSLDPRYMIRDILKEAMRLDGVGSEQRLQEMLTAVGLEKEMLNRYPHEFSGGERQRIAIARALSVNPQLLILDEAVSSLDVLVQEQILKLLEALQKQFNLTYLFISHNLKVVRKMSQRIAVMYQGKIVELAKTEDIFKNPVHPYTRELLSAAIHYKSMTRQEMRISSHSRLVDQGEGHFVLI